MPKKKKNLINTLLLVVPFQDIYIWVYSHIYGLVLFCSNMKLLEFVLFITLVNWFGLLVGFRVFPASCQEGSSPIKVGRIGRGRVSPIISFTLKKVVYSYMHRWLAPQPPRCSRVNCIYVYSRVWHRGKLNWYPWLSEWWNFRWFLLSSSYFKITKVCFFQ